MALQVRPGYVEPGLPVKNAMFPAKINDLHATAARFLHSHRNCLVEITFSGLACTYAEDGGVLYSIELGTKPGGNVDLHIVLRNSDGSRAVKTVRNIRSLDTTGRVLSVASETGVQENLECVGLHDAAGREKLLLIRHLAEMGQA